MTDVVVRTERGRVRGLDQSGLVVVKGVPYGAAPEGPLRFRAPAPAAAWDGVRDCVAFGAAPPQRSPAPGAPPSWRPGDGLDCLTLNLWTPDLAPSGAGLPVMVWIYGGLWKHGTASMPHYDAAALARGGVVVVTLNYRVGFEGFGHLPGVPDNRGLLDQIAALAWVQRNIAAFGGDPDRVTVFGQSAGAASVALLVAAPAARGLFRRAIAQSIPDGYRSRAEAQEVTAALAAAAGVPVTWEGFAALAPEAILAVQDVPLSGGHRGLTAFGPVVDGELVTGPPWTPIAEGRGRDVDLVCGFTHEEFRGMGPVPDLTGVDLADASAALGLDRDAGAAYRAADPGRTDAELFVTMASDALVRRPTCRVAEAHARAGGRTWLYDLTWASPGIGAGHGVDLPLVFGDGTSRYAARILGSPPLPEFAALSEQMQRSWTGFAATGDPGWPRYEVESRPTERRSTRLWDAVPSVENDPLVTSREIWDRVRPRLP